MLYKSMDMRMMCMLYMLEHFWIDGEGHTVKISDRLFVCLALGSFTTVMSKIGALELCQKTIPGFWRVRTIVVTCRP